MVIETANSGRFPKKKSTAILLNLIFFGGLGLHRFYVGKTTSGAVLLVLSILSSGLVGVIWGLCDLFTLIFTDKFTDGDGLQLS